MMINFSSRLFIQVFFLLLSTGLFPQQVEMEKRISLNYTHEKLETILEGITEQTGVNFSYNAREISVKERMTLKVENATLAEVLDLIAQHYSLQYLEVSGQMVLRSKPQAPVERKFTISGIIRDNKTGETLPGATVAIGGLLIGTSANSYGFYSLTIPEGIYSIIFSFLGYQNQVLEIDLSGNLRKDAELIPQMNQLNEVLVMVSRNPEDISGVDAGKLNLVPDQLALLPEFAGENGLIKSLQSVPGIQTHSDGSAFFFVRGGNKDQNLILIDEAPVYNPAHLFGFYSVIIPDVAREINIHKADLPVDKGGRLSSVIDVQTRDGNMKKPSVEGIFNPLVYRISAETPVVRNKVSVFASYRRSNFKWLYQRIAPNGEFFLQDFNAKINWIINPNNRVYFSFFNGADNYTTPDNNVRTGITWHNTTSTFRWNHIFGPRTFANFTFYVSEFEYRLLTGAPAWQSGIADVGLKYDLTWYPKPEVTWKAGLSMVSHQINPGNLTGYDEAAEPFIPKVYAGRASEAVIYVNREFQPGEKWQWNTGIRFPLWITRGPAFVFLFDENFYVSDTLTFESGDEISRFFIPEIRLGARYKTSTHGSIRFSAGNYVQHLHLITNSISPFSSFEIWLPSSTNIRPQQAWQATLGYNHFFAQSNIELITDIYLKRMTHQLSYRDHARLLLNPLIEGELRQGSTESQGLEIMLRRTTGPVSGWVAYSWTKTQHHFPGENNSQPYSAYYDRPHDLSAFLAFKTGKRSTLSLQWTYYTGSAISTPTGFFEFNGSSVPYYEFRNNSRLPDYHRLDAAMQWQFGKPEHRFRHNLTLGVYNVYNRNNPVSLNFNKIMDLDGQFVVQENVDGTNPFMSTQKYLSTIMPSLTYKFYFQ